MTPFVQFVTLITSLGVVTMNVATLFLIFALIVPPGKNGKPILTWVSTHALSLSLLIAGLSLGGSYYYSLIAGFAPCKLCWFLRIFLFSHIALYILGRFRERGVFACSFILSIFALLVGAFQYYGSMFNPAILAACEANGVSCSKNYFVYFGYINIPFMALSAFALLAMIALIRIQHSGK